MTYYIKNAALSLAIAAILPSCRNAVTRDYPAEINAAMESFQALCTKAYADTLMDSKAREKFIDARYDSLCSVLLDITEDALEEHTSDSVAVDIISLQYSLQLVDEQKALDNIARLDPKIQDRADIGQMKKAIERRLGTSVGSQFTDFEAESPDGSKVHLSDYAGKGQYCLVDFWASWCGPCRHEIPNIRAAYEKYSSKGLNVVSVAVWDKPEDTAAAAQELGISWYQMVNSQAEPTEIYGIDGIPHIMLIGPDGKILARGLRGEGIEEELGKHF